MDMENLNEVLEDHKKWVSGTGGEKADLSGADLCMADLRRANLRGANLHGADLCGADLDMSCWPLWCGSFGVKIDEKLKKQLMYHVIDACGSEMFTDDQVEFANGFHRVGEINEIKRRG